MDTSDDVINMGMAVNVARLVVGVNDLFTMNPELAVQWHPAKNGVLTPQGVTVGSSKKVWWICPLFHEWETTPSHRLNGSGCPYCAGQSILVGFNDLATINPEIAAQWHPTKNGMVTPRHVTSGTNKKFWWICALDHEWESSVKTRSTGSGCPKCSGREPVFGVTDLATTNPQLAAQWHPTKNASLMPHHVTAGSGQKVWWLCDIGHGWETQVSKRSRGDGCPFCSNKRVLVGFNDLLTTNPEIAAQWHPTKNVDLTPQDVSAGSHKKAVWLCPLSHEWTVPIVKRLGGSGCPTCSGKCVLIGFNDLQTTNPELAAQWHLTRNETLTPQCVTAGANKKAWWVCIQLHEWEAQIASRSAGVGCPVCAGKQVLRGFNDLATVNPSLAEQWHPTKNGAMTPQEVTQGSQKIQWWTCALSHEWKATVSNRSGGRGCPFCSGNRVLVGFNDLGTVAPELSKQWHPNKNGYLTPQNVTVNSGQKAWWICALSHEWEVAVANRTMGSGCPTCAGKRVLAGYNDLATFSPDLAKQWHPTKNGKLTPQKVTRSSDIKAWWICSLSHEWEVSINGRASGSGCPRCASGTTERTFREAFEKHSELTFSSCKIPLVRHSRKSSRAQIDMLSHELKLVIEYDGEWTHGANGPEGKTLDQKLTEDKETTQALVDIGYNVIRIREHSNKSILPLVPVTPEYEPNVAQIIYKSFGKDKDVIEDLAKKIIEEKKDWFKTSSEISSIIVH